MRATGAQVVLLATELGLAQEIRLAREIRGVDFILGGHTHERTTSPVTDGGTPVIQAGSEGSFLARVKFRLANGRVVGHEHELLGVSPKRYTPDTNVTASSLTSAAPMKPG